MYSRLLLSFLNKVDPVIQVVTGTDWQTRGISAESPGGHEPPVEEVSLKIH
jgi:hypothetical protein